MNDAPSLSPPHMARAELEAYLLNVLQLIGVRAAIMDPTAGVGAITIWRPERLAQRLALHVVPKPVSGS